MKKLSSFLGVSLLAAAVPLAHAGLEINYTINGGTTVTCPIAANPNPAASCTNVTTGPLNVISLGANSNAPGGDPSFETSATSTLQNTSGGTDTIVINVISTGFMTPTAPPVIDLLSHIGGSTPVLNTGTNSVSFISCVDASNSQTLGCPATDNAPTITPTLTNAKSYDGDSSSTISTLASPYSIDEQITVVLSAGSILNFSASTTLIPTPEPASIMLLGAAIFLVGRAIRRKRQQQPSRDAALA